MNKVTNSLTYCSATKQWSSQQHPCSRRWCILTHAYRGDSWKHLQNTKHNPLLTCCHLFLALFAGKSANLVVACLSFPPAERLSFRNLCRRRGSGCVGSALSRWWSLDGPKIGWEPKRRCLFSFCTQVYEHFLSIAVHFFLYIYIYICLVAVHSVDLNRCSPSASHYLRHPPIICFTNLPPPPSPLLASPLILDLDHPSAARNCVSAAHEGTTRPARM